MPETRGGAQSFVERAGHDVPAVPAPGTKVLGKSACPKAPSDAQLKEAMTKASSSKKSQVAVSKGSPARVLVSEFPGFQGEGGTGEKRGAVELSSPLVDKKRANTSEGMDTDEKHKTLEKLKVTLSPQKTTGGSTGHKSQVEPSNAEVLSAVKALETKLATKEDLATLRTELETAVTTFVETRVKPLEDKLEKLTQEHEALKKKVATLEVGGGFAKAGDKEDPARKQVAVLGWPEGCEAKKRLQDLKEWVQTNFPEVRAVAFSNEYKGPYSNRVLGKATYAHFAAEDDVRTLVKAAKDRSVELKVEGKKLKVVPAKTKKNKQRDWALRKAEEVLKTSVPTQKVEVDWKERRVTANTAEAFKQEKEDTKGSFCGNFSHLALPA